MAKVIVNMGYKSYVLDAKDAVALCEIIGGAERYESKYHSKTDTHESHNTHHIYPVSLDDSSFSMQMLTDEAYKLYKLAGKPDGNY